MSTICQLQDFATIHSDSSGRKNGDFMEKSTGRMGYVTGILNRTSRGKWDSNIPWKSGIAWG